VGVANLVQRWASVVTLDLPPPHILNQPYFRVGEMYNYKIVYCKTYGAL